MLIRGGLLQGRRLALGSGQQAGDVVPQRLPRLSFRLGQLSECLRPTHPCEIDIHSPVPHFLGDNRANRVRILVEAATPLLQVGAQPVQALSRKELASAAWRRKATVDYFVDPAASDLVF
jgi:hypothetical protein